MINIIEEEYREALGAGFYKIDQDGIFHYAPNFVKAPDYELYKEDKDSYTYPTNGWYWFEDEVIARQFFNLPELPPEE